jgi:hypothetical protein
MRHSYFYQGYLDTLNKFAESDDYESFLTPQARDTLLGGVGAGTASGAIAGGVGGAFLPEALKRHYGNSRIRFGAIDRIPLAMLGIGTGGILGGLVGAGIGLPVGMLRHPKEETEEE